MKVVNIKEIKFGDYVYAAYKTSYGYQSGGYEGPLHFSKINDNIVDPISKNKEGRVYFLDSASANNFKKNFDKAKKEFKIKSSGYHSTSECLIYELKNEKPITYKNLFNGTETLSFKKRMTRYGEAYELID